MKNAVFFWIRHAEIVEEEGLFQDGSISRFLSRSVQRSAIYHHSSGQYAILYFRMESSLLHIASKHGLLSVLKALRKPDYNINAQDGDSMTPLCLAVYRGHEEVVRWLLKWENIKTSAIIRIPGKDLWSPLTWAVQSEQEAVAKMLLERKDDVMADFADNEKQTALHWMIRRGLEGLLELLLKRNDVDVNIRNKNGETPLHRAAGAGQESQ